MALDTNTCLDPSKYIGNWPSKGAVIYYHFAKLYLTQYVFRGIPDTSPIPDHFLETASSAVSAATTIVQSLVDDRELQASLNRVPHYFHGMIAFACMFMLKVATKHAEQLFVDVAKFRLLIAGFARQLKITEVSRDHLLHRMAEGLEKMVQMLGGEKTRFQTQGYRPKQENEFGSNNLPIGAITSSFSLQNGGQGLLQHEQPQHFESLIDPASIPFDFGDSALGLGFFDFEGTAADLGSGDTGTMFPPFVP